MKKIINWILITILMTVLITGCDSEKITEPTAAPTTENSGVEGKVLNIYCWNTEFQTRVTEHYEAYEKLDDTTGKIGDITVKWNITPNEDNAYQNNLDKVLEKQAEASSDEKIDIFLVEADYAIKYTGSDYTMAIEELGITDEDIADQYEYTQDVVTVDGVLKGLSWQGCPGVLFYNREAAKEILGTDDADTVQAAVTDWATFIETAQKANEKGYKMVSSVNDTYRVYSNNVSSKWVEDGKINIDENLMNWVNDSKVLAEAGFAGTHALWSEEWSAGFYPEGKVFCYFGPAWLVNFSMDADVEGSIGYLGGWGATEGPQSFFWGGSWICASTGTDNIETIKDIMLTLTTDEEVMKNIVSKNDDFVNNKPAMKAMAKDTSYSSKILGDMNPLSMYCAGAESINLDNSSAYDQACNEEFQNAMKNYFDGNASLDEALDLFYKAVTAKHPELTY